MDSFGMRRSATVSMATALILLLGACAHTSPGLPKTDDPVIAAAGDIGCDPTNKDFNAGAGTTDACAARATSDILVELHPAAVLVLGDEQYPCGDTGAFTASYDPTWGRVKAVSRPVPGNQEYNQDAGCSIDGQARGYFDYFGKAAGNAGEGWYSFNIGSWHVIALNANCDAIGGCDAGSPQEAWLKNDLTADTALCTLAFWHQPRFGSGSHGNDLSTAAFWDDLYAANADLVLNGHDHGYERFAPQDPGQQPDSEHGIREFIVGTGGEDHGSIHEVQPNSEVQNADTFGALELSLHPAGYDWLFAPVAGSTFTDSGSGTCH